MADSIEIPWEQQALVLHQKFHHRDYLRTDPLEYVHRAIGPVEDPLWTVNSLKLGRRIELVALLSALLAYGGVKQIRGSIESALDQLGYLRPGQSEIPDLKKLQKFKHRFTTQKNLECLLRCVVESWNTYGSLGAHLMQGYDPHKNSVPIESALNQWLDDYKSQIPRSQLDHGMKHLLSQPRDGSACKRWMMFLRWMVRVDPIGERFLDIGLWSNLPDGRSSGAFQKTFKGSGIHSRNLLMPLDTHTGRIAQYYGLTRRKSLGWDAVLEVTQALKTLDAEDPIKFDFALCRLGIVEGWKP